MHKKHKKIKTLPNERVFISEKHLPHTRYEIQFVHNVFSHEAQLDYQICSISYNISLSRNSTFSTL